MTARVLFPTDILPFIREIQRSCSHHGLRWEQKPLRIGACVSGGPDSMALAYMLSELRKQKTDIHYLSAFIVDHKARPESTEEAVKVQHNLTEIGVESTILTMDWPDNINPLKLSDFESQARLKRYKLLARSALAQKIHHLFLGHHQDDQVETILMRLIRNENISLKGLAGMASTSSVPCAFDMFGVHVQQRDVLVPVRASFPSSMQRPDPSDSRKLLKGLHRITVPGGIKLERPLLPFSKADLVATCHQNHIPYIIDPTNKDPTSSLRNAVRHLRAHHILPRALNTASILRLQNLAQHHIDRVKAAGEAVLSTCKFHRLDLRSGQVRVHIPLETCKDQNDMDAYGYAISKLTEMVTPNVRANHATRVPVHVISRFCAITNMTGCQTVQRETSTAFSHDRVLFVPDRVQPDVWTLSRQPMRAAEIQDNTMSFQPAARQQSKRLLWDNRYWVQVSNVPVAVLKDLELRPLRDGDLDSLAGKRSGGQLGDWRLAKLHKQLQVAAPGKVRFTLPVLTFKGELVAVPTFDYQVSDVVRKMGLKALEWEVFYNASSLLDRLQARQSTLRPNDDEADTDTD